MSAKASPIKKFTEQKNEIVRKPEIIQKSEIQLLLIKIEKLEAKIEKLQLQMYDNDGSIDQLFNELSQTEKALLYTQNQLRTVKDAVSTVIRLFFGMFKRLISRATRKEEKTLSIVNEFSLSSIPCTLCLEPFEIRKDSNYTGTDFTCNLCRIDKKSEFRQPQQPDFDFRLVSDTWTDE